VRDIIYYVAFLNVLLSFVVVLWGEPLALLCYLLLNSLVVATLAYMLLDAEKQIEELKEER